MNTASKTTVAQTWAAGAGTPLMPMLRKARQMFYGVVSRDPQEINLRELPDGTCQVIFFSVPNAKHMAKLAEKGLVPGADGVVVVAQGPNWISLLGLRPNDG